MSEPTKEQRQAISDLLLRMRDRMARGEEINWLAMPHEIWRALSESGNYSPLPSPADRWNGVRDAMLAILREINRLPRVHAEPMHAAYDDLLTELEKAIRSKTAGELRRGTGEPGTSEIR